MIITVNLNFLFVSLRFLFLPVDVVLDTTLCDRACQWLAAGLWSSLCTMVSSTYKTEYHYITDTLLKVTLTITSVFLKTILVFSIFISNAEDTYIVFLLKYKKKSKTTATVCKKNQTYCLLFLRRTYEYFVPFALHESGTRRRALFGQ